MHSNSIDRNRHNFLVQVCISQLNCDIMWTTWAPGVPDNFSDIRALFIMEKHKDDISAGSVHSYMNNFHVSISSKQSNLQEQR